MLEHPCTLSLFKWKIGEKYNKKKEKKLQNLENVSYNIGYSIMFRVIINNVKLYNKGGEVFMKQKKRFNAVLALALAGQMAITAAPVYAADNTADNTDAGTASVQYSADASNKPMADGNKLRMWYTSPGTRSDWENSSLVIGNGKTGGILFGQVANDQIHFNEKTLWRGGPSESRPNYDGGNRDTAVTEEQLEAIRQKLDNHTTSVFPQGTSTVSEVWGDGNGMGQYQDFGDLYLDFSATGVTNDNVDNYVRDLDMRTGVSSVNFDYEGVHYEREYFASHPDKAVVTRLTASESGKISFTASVQAASGLTTTQKAEDGKITLAGQVSDNQMKCEMQAQIVNEGGTIKDNEDGTVTVENADAVTIVYSTDTDYKNEYPDYRTGETAEELSASLAETVDAAAGKSYDDLRADHVADYSELFGRVEIDLGGECAQKPINEMMADYRKGNHDHVLEEMVFQFGRYLTIAASREGDELPSNLCGIWMIGSAGSYWGADFHFNVNVQMNYWPAYQTNLAECGSVFTDYVESLVQPGRVTAERSAAQKTDDVINTPIGEGNGFLVNTQNNPFGCTAPFGGQEYGWNVTGSSWALQNVYDQYLYTQDTKVLEDTIYPMLKEMTNFWDGFLWWSDYQDRLVVGPSFSAEQGPTTNGTTYDQSLVWELYEMAIEASETLGVDADEREAWKETQSQLNPIIIGDEGQVKEWYEETTTGKAQAGDLAEVNIPNFGAGGSANQGSLHRHTSQLIGLYPGTLINKDNEEWMEAAIRTLEIRDERGSAGEVGPAGTGWSKAHKLNMWARTGNGENTYKLISGMIAGNKNGILDNFLDSHPPYQIDGNYGLTAGISEALVQSQLGYTQFLPAVSEAWAEGNVQGLVARGNFVIGMEWSENSADRFTVTSRSGGTFTGEYTGLAAYEVKTADGTPVEVTKLSDDRISFPTEEGQTYVIDFNSSPVKLQAQVDAAKELSAQMTDEVLAEAKAVLDACITESEQIIADQDSSKYYDQTKALAAACDTARAAIALKDAYVAADAVYQAADPDEEWAVYLELVTALRGQLDSAAAVLADPDAVKADYSAAQTALEEASAALSGLADQLVVTFSPGTGTISVGDEITLSSKFDDLQIRYTTDGNEPMSFSAVYEEPIVMTGKTMTVKAALFSGTRQMGDVFTSVYSTGSDRINVAPDAQDAAVSSQYSASYSGWKAIDGNRNEPSRWATPDNTYTAWLQLKFAEPVTVDGAGIVQYNMNMTDRNIITNFNIEYWDGTQWAAALAGQSMGSNGSAKEWTGNFEPVTSDQFRLNIVAGVNPTIYEFELYKYEETQTEEADKSALQNAIAQAEAAIENGEVAGAPEEIQNSFMEVYNYAVAVNENAASSQDTIDRTYKALMDELQKVSASQPVSKRTLEYFLNQAKGYVEDGTVAGCIESVQKLFEEAIAEGDAVMADENATRKEVVNAAAKLMYAIQALDMKAADKTDLEMAVELGDMIDLTQYVEEGQAEFKDALLKAKEVLADGDAFQDEVDSAWDALVDAIAALRLKADKSVLEQLISQMEGLDLTVYTEESVAVFRTAFAAANSIYLDETLSVDDQAKVDDAVDALQAAYEGLEKKQSGEPENPGGDDTDDPQNPGSDDTDNPQNPGGDSGNTGGQGGTTAGQSQNKNSGAVQTGDSTSAVAAGVTLVLAAAAAAVVLLRRRKTGF